MAKIVAIVNQKGGVGKTTTCVNLAAALKYLGKRVLLCDFDPQANATSGMGVDKSVSNGVYDVLINGVETRKAIVTTPYGDVLPSSKALAGGGVEMIEMADRQFLLRSALDAVRETGLPFIETFHAAIAEAARKGALVIVDHVIGESRAWVQDLLNRLSGIPRALIKVDCREDILLERERNRTDRTPDPAHAERQYGSIHQNFPHDFSIDTSEATPRECAQKLMEQLPPEFRATQE